MDSSVVGCYGAITCPHCGTNVSANKYPYHERTCVESPALRAAMAAVLESDTPGVGITSQEYRAISGELGIPSKSSIMRRYGTWSEALASFGLQAPRQGTRQAREAARADTRLKPAQIEEAAIADVDKMSEATRRVVAGEYEAAHTFHGYKVRDLSGVTVNGKPCQIVTLR